jgi:lipopolysaccharide export system permease protein
MANKTLNTYIFFELIPPFVMSLAFFMFVFLMGQLLDITNMIVNYQVSITVFALLLVLSLPYFLVYIIPMATMMSVLLTFLRMSGDNEIVALKAGGVSMYRMLPPVLIFSVLCMVITGLMGLYGMPWGKTAYDQLALDAARTNFNIALQANTFNNAFPGVVFYVNNIDLQTRELHDVFIEDNRQSDVSTTVVASRGYLFSGENPYVFTLRLYDGMLNNVQIDTRSAHATRFDTYDIRLDLHEEAEAGRDRPRDRREMMLSELIEYVNKAEKKDRRYYAVLMELHMKFSIPFACVALAVLAVPLGIQTLTSKRSAGLGIGLICFLFYYLLLSAGMVLGETGVIPPVFGMWMPNLIMGGLGAYLWIKTAKDSPVALLEYIRDLGAGVMARIKDRFGAGSET